MQRCSSPRSMDYLKATRVEDQQGLRDVTQCPVCRVSMGQPSGRTTFQWPQHSLVIHLATLLSACHQPVVKGPQTGECRILARRERLVQAPYTLYANETALLYFSFYPPIYAEPRTGQPLLTERGPWHPGVGAVAATANPHPTNNTLP